MDNYTGTTELIRSYVVDFYEVMDVIADTKEVVVDFAGTLYPIANVYFDRETERVIVKVTNETV